MLIPPGWPYATKAVLQHNFDVNHLDLFMTFYEKMNILLLPPTVNFYWRVDGSQVGIDIIAWLDPWTLKFINYSVDDDPDKVTLEYRIPTPLLITVGGKQWDIFGEILSQEI